MITAMGKNFISATSIIPAREDESTPESTPRHSGESRNPVVYTIHARLGGNDNKGGMPVRRRPEFVYHPAIALLDSSFRWNDDEAVDADR